MILEVIDSRFVLGLWRVFKHFDESFDKNLSLLSKAFWHYKIDLAQENITQIITKICRL